MYETERIILRQWHEQDLEPFAAMNQDPKVMEFFPNLLTRSESQAMIEKYQAKMVTQGFGFYACELKSTHAFIGFVGLNIPDFQASFTPCVEIGWRLRSEFWGQELAVEAAHRCVELGFKEFKLDNIVSFTAAINLRSQRVMQKLGMVREPEHDFYNPKVPLLSPLALHVLYRMTK
jgi:RimJ/RimL family protein N-acetyltransferase